LKKSALFFCTDRDGVMKGGDASPGNRNGPQEYGKLSTLNAAGLRFIKLILIGS